MMMIVSLILNLKKGKNRNVCSEEGQTLDSSKEPQQAVKTYLYKRGTSKTRKPLRVRTRNSFLAASVFFLAWCIKISISCCGRITFVRGYRRRQTRTK